MSLFTSERLAFIEREFTSWLWQQLFIWELLYLRKEGLGVWDKLSKNYSGIIENVDSISPAPSWFWLVGQRDVALTCLVVFRKLNYFQLKVPWVQQAVQSCPLSTVSAKLHTTKMDSVSTKKCTGWIQVLTPNAWVGGPIKRHSSATQIVFNTNKSNQN